MRGFEALHQRFRAHARFATVYIREAHPTDGIAIEGTSRIGSGWSLKQPRLLSERAVAARQLRDALGAASPFFVDGMADEAMTAYVAWPERIFVIDETGVLAYVGGFGPEGYDVLELEQFLEARFGRADGSPASVAGLIRDVAR